MKIFTFHFKEELFVNYAFVIPASGWQDDNLTRDRIIQMCQLPVTTADGKQDQLKDFEIPRQIIFIKELPRRSGTDKINYSVLEEKAMTIDA